MLQTFRMTKNRFMAFLWNQMLRIAVSFGITFYYYFFKLCFYLNQYYCFETIGTPRVFTNFKETLSAVKSNKTARFKLFRSATEAERFSVFGHELPIKQTEKNIPNVSTGFTFKSLKSEDLVAFRRLIEGGELDKVKLAVNSNPRFLVSSGDTPSIIQVKYF